MLQRTVCLFVALSLVAMGTDLIAQTRIEVVRTDHAVSEGGPALPLTEPYVAVNPDDPQHLVAGTIVAPTGEDTPWRCAAFTSLDGGGSWLRHDFDMERCIDPWILFTPGDAVLFTGIELHRDHEAEQQFHLVAYRSEDGGRTWPAKPVSLGRTDDHAMLVAKRTAPEAIYLTSQRTRRTADDQARQYVYLARSDDDGHTFQNLAAMTSDDLPVKPTGLALLPDGTLFIAYQERYEEGRTEEDSLAAISIRGRRSEDGGRTFSPPFFITDGCGSGAIARAFLGYPFLAVEASDKPSQGQLYHACILPGAKGIGVTRSSDGGRTWSGLVRSDTPPDDGPAHIRTPMLAVNHDGVVGVAWYDRRHDPERQCQDVYFTASLDGGVTFLEPTRLSTQTSCPNAPSNGRAGESWPMGGDYSSLTAGPDGLFHLLWADSRSGQFQLRHAAVRVTGQAGETDNTN